MGRKQRAGEPHRRRLNEARRRRAWDRRSAITAVAGLTVAGVGVIALLWWVTSLPAFAAGFLCGSYVTGVAAIAFWAVDHGAGAHNDKFGLYGEEQTAELFSGTGWEIRHNLEFGDSDVDHVVFS